MKICIDPGHGGKDTGAKWYDLHEKDVNLDIGLRLERKLKENNIIVYMTRRDDKYLSLKDRTNIINSKDCDLTISIHNSSSANDGLGGSEIIYPKSSDKAKELSSNILEELGKLGLVKRRIYFKVTSSGNDYFYIIREANNLAVIVECAFISNLENNQSLKDECFREKIATAIKDGILDLKEKYYKEEEHWANEYFNTLKNKQLVNKNHNLDTFITWGELSEIITKLIDHKKIKD